MNTIEELQAKRLLWALIEAIQSMDNIKSLWALADSLDRDWAMNNFNDSEHYFLKKQTLKHLLNQLKGMKQNETLRAEA